MDASINLGGASLHGRIPGQEVNKEELEEEQKRSNPKIRYIFGGGEYQEAIQMIDQNLLKECMAVKERMEEASFEGLPEDFEERQKRVEEVKEVIDRNEVILKKEIDVVINAVKEEAEVLSGHRDQNDKEENCKNVPIKKIIEKDLDNVSSEVQKDLQSISDSIASLEQDINKPIADKFDSEASELLTSSPERMISPPDPLKLSKFPVLDSINVQTHNELISELQNIRETQLKELKFNLTKDPRNFIEKLESQKEELKTNVNVSQENTSDFNQENKNKEGHFVSSVFNKFKSIYTNFLHNDNPASSKNSEDLSFDFENETITDRSVEDTRNNRVMNIRKERSQRTSKSFLQNEDLKLTPQRQQWSNRNEKKDQRALINPKSYSVSRKQDSCSSTIGQPRKFMSKDRYLTEPSDAHPGPLKIEKREVMDSEAKSKDKDMLEKINFQSEESRDIDFGKIIELSKKYFKVKKENDQMFLDIKNLNSKIHRKIVQDYVKQREESNGYAYFIINQYQEIPLTSLVEEKKKINDLMPNQKGSCKKLFKLFTKLNAKLQQIKIFLAFCEPRNEEWEQYFNTIINQEKLFKQDILKIITFCRNVIEMTQSCTTKGETKDPHSALSSCTTPKSNTITLANSPKSSPKPPQIPAKTTPKRNQKEVESQRFKFKEEIKQKEIEDSTDRELGQLNIEVQRKEIDEERYNKLLKEYTVLYTRAKIFKQQYDEGKLKLNMHIDNWKQIAQKSMKHMNDSLNVQNSNETKLVQYLKTMNIETKKYNSEIQRYHKKQEELSSQNCALIQSLRDINKHKQFKENVKSLHKAHSTLTSRSNSITKTLSSFLNTISTSYKSAQPASPTSSPKSISTYTSHSETLCRTKVKLLLLLYIKQGHLQDQTKWERQVKELQRRRKQQDQESMYMEYEGAIIGLKRVREVVDESSSAMVLPVEGRLSLSCLADDFSNVLEKAGQEFENACKVYAEQYKTMKMGDAAVFPAGNLKFDKIIAAYCPDYDKEFGENKSIYFLNKTIKRVLYLSYIYQLKSILIPSFCTERSRIPTKLYANTVVKTVKDYINGHKRIMKGKRITICYSSHEDEQRFADLILQEQLQFPSGYLEQKYPVTKEEAQIIKMELELGNSQNKISDLLRIKDDIKEENEKYKSCIASLEAENKELKSHKTLYKSKFENPKEESKELPRKPKMVRTSKSRAKYENKNVYKEERKTSKGPRKPKTIPKKGVYKFTKKIIESTTTESELTISRVGPKNETPSGITDSSLSSEYVEGHNELLGRKGSGIIKFE
ncbi:unnamed protein product [Moneuplotes crassus]|uniref:Macro domain-containing protein n=1 Tax=Euplotes crassus TaxID=5936 RepID=A0AAD1XT10_EUPCR|nr:unnamed protein product [Moneuplotes crassus]